METRPGQDGGALCCLFKDETLLSVASEKPPGPSTVNDKFIINDRPDVENTTYTHTEMKSEKLRKLKYEGKKTNKQK